MFDYPTIALAARWQTYPERFRWIRENGFALEYAPNPAGLDQLANHVAPFIQDGIPVRYHGFLPGYEIGHQDGGIRERAMNMHRSLLKVMCGLGQPVITVHIGLNPADEINPEKAVENLTELVEYAGSLGITVCLENLRRGPTSHPENVSEWARESGAMITFDVGHAVSCQRVLDGELTALEFLEIVSDRLWEAHLYEREIDRHYPPHNMTLLGPIVDRLLGTRCRWWTLELDDYAEALKTRELLLDYLKKKGGGYTTAISSG